MKGYTPVHRIAGQKFRLFIDRNPAGKEEFQAFCLELSRLCRKHGLRPVGRAAKARRRGVARRRRAKR
jgi:hypothetical protein